MTKIIDKIREYCFKKNYEYKKNLSRFMKDNKDFDGKIILSSTDIETIKQWGDSNGVDKEKINNFVAYIKLRLMANYFYQIKNKDLMELAEKYPEVVYWDDSNNCVAIMLEEYAFPMSFHFIVNSTAPDMFNPSRYDNINIDRNTDKYIYCFPMKLDKSERKAFDKAMIEKYPESIPTPNIKKGEQEIEDSQTDKENSENIIVNTDGEIKGDVIENMKDDALQNVGDVKTEKIQEVKDKNHEKRRYVKYRANEEIVKVVVDELKKSGVVSNISEECMEKLLYVSPSQAVKLEKVYNNIKEIVISSKIDEDKVSVETAKLFTYLKLLDRGFWHRGIVKGISFEDYVKKAMEEMSTKFGKEFFDGISIGEEMDELKKYMDEKLPRSRGWRITGAKTLQKNQENEIIETDGAKEGEIKDTVKKEEHINDDTKKEERKDDELQRKESKDNEAQKEESKDDSEIQKEETKDNEIQKEERKNVEDGYTEEDKAKMEELRSKSSESLTLSLKETIHNLQEEHKELENLKKELEQKNEELRGKVTNLSVDYERHTKSIQDIEDVFNDPENVDFLKKIGEFENLQNKYNLIKKKLDELKEIQSKLTKGNEKIDQINRRQTQIEEEVKNRIEEEFGDL